ncbi:ABC transporter B family member 11-like [Aegilops tauschii subsp. strangulata]|nr:ABC transporter B family member 11-like [Aegilops tauschii subsp. strangulata]
MDATAEASSAEGARHGAEQRTDDQPEKVSLLGMLRYADRLDMLLMVIGSLGAVGNGASGSLLLVLYGDAINSFGESTTSTVLPAVTKVVLNFIYLGIGTAVASFLQMSCWAMSGERQSARIRSLYLKSVLRQDIAFFDTEMTTGEAVSRMSSDTVIIQDALGEKAAKLIQTVSAFFGGFIVAFTKGWLLTLVMLTSLPLVAIAGAVSAQLLTGVSSKRLTSYSDAADTVVSFNGEKKAIEMYNKFNKNAYKTAVEEGLVNGFGMGSVFCIILSSYGLGFWYGGKLILDKGYTGGKIITVLFAVVSFNGEKKAIEMYNKFNKNAYKTAVEEGLVNGFGMGSVFCIILSSYGLGFWYGGKLILDKGYTGGKIITVLFAVLTGANNSNRHSFKNPSGLSLELHEDAITGEQDKEGLPDQKTLQKAAAGRLFYLNKPELPFLLLGTIAASVHGIIFPLYGLLISGGLKSFYEPPDKMRKDSSFWALIFVVLGFASFIAIIAEYLLFAIAGGKLIERVRTLSFQNIVHQEVAWFDNPSNSSGALGTRLSIDALNVRRLVGDNLGLIVQSIASLIAGFVIAFMADWRLALIITCVIPLLGAQGYAQAKFLKGFGEEAKEMYEDASQVATDAVGSIRTIASFCAEKRVVTTYNKKCKALRKQGIRSGIVGGLGFGFSFLVLYLTFALCFYVGAQFIRQGKSSFADVFKVFLVLVLATLGVSQASALASNATKAKDSTITVFSILDRKSKIDTSSDEGMMLENVTGDIDFSNVSFKYPSRPDVQIFSDFTLHIPSRKTIALVGESGSGKSTIISLLERFYDPDSGSISVDGVEIKSLRISWLRHQMGLVGQELVLFNDTIRANITYGEHGEVTEEEVTGVAKAANAHEFISSLPQGYNTLVGEKGVQLSGGQKQRVAITRAIIKDPKILLLDEATSALDAESEHIVQDALDRVMVSRTTIVVAHRLSTIKGADAIAVLKEGKIAEKRNHEVLMRIKDGVYASLVELCSNSK